MMEGQFGTRTIRTWIAKHLETFRKRVALDIVHKMRMSHSRLVSPAKEQYSRNSDNLLLNDNQFISQAPPIKSTDLTKIELQR